MNDNIAACYFCRQLKEIDNHLYGDILCQKCAHLNSTLLIYNNYLSKEVVIKLLKYNGAYFVLCLEYNSTSLYVFNHEKLKFEVFLTMPRLLIKPQNAEMQYKLWLTFK